MFKQTTGNTQTKYGMKEIDEYKWICSYRLKFKVNNLFTVEAQHGPVLRRFIVVDSLTYALYGIYIYEYSEEKRILEEVQVIQLNKKNKIRLCGIHDGVIVAFGEDAQLHLYKIDLNLSFLK